MGLEKCVRRNPLLWFLKYPSYFSLNLIFPKIFAMIKNYFQILPLNCIHREIININCLQLRILSNYYWVTNNFLIITELCV